MNKKLKWSLVTVGVLIAIAVIGGKKKTAPSESETIHVGSSVVTTHTTVAKPAIDPRGAALAHAVLSDDIAVAVRGGDSLIGLANLGIEHSVTSLQLAREYTDNEVAADVKYKHRLFLVSGRIKSINKDISDSAYLSLPGIDDFSPVQAHLDDDGAADAASYKRGTNITLVCIGAGMIIQSPMLRDCLPAGRYASRLDKEWAGKLSTWFSDGGKWAGDDRSGIALATMYAARSALPDETACDTNVGGSACHADLQRAMKASGPAILAEYARVRGWLNLPESVPLPGSAAQKKSVG